MQECQPSQVLFDYLQQELPPDQLARIEAHLPHCAACRDELHRLRQQIQQVQATLAQLDPAPGWPAKPQPDLIRLPARPVSFIPLPRLAVAFTAAVMLILGAVVHLTGDQSVLAYSLERLKMVGAVSMSLRRATSMDCTALISGVGGEYSRYRVRWCATGLTRVDVDSAGGTQTLRMSNKAVSIADYLGGAAHAPAITEMPSDRIWQPALEFLTPTILAQYVEEQYALMQAEGRDGAGSEEFLLVGQENQQVVEIAVDARTYLPKTLKKYLPDSGRTREKRECLMEVRFQWNQPIPQELLVPESPAGRSQVNH